jgi:hypothetical protein
LSRTCIAPARMGCPSHLAQAIDKLCKCIRVCMGSG